MGTLKRHASKNPHGPLGPYLSLNLISLRSLKAFALRELPPCALREILLSEPDTLEASQFIERLAVWLRLSSLQMNGESR